MLSRALLNTVTGGKADLFNLHEHTLILEGAPSTSGNIRFELKRGNNNTDGQNEIRLKDSDLFFAFYMGINLTKVDITNKNYSNPLFTYPDVSYFTGTEAAALMTIYRGKTTVKTGSTDRIIDLANLHYLHTPERVAADVAATLPQYGPSLTEKGLKELQPMPMFDGNLTNEVAITFGQGDFTGIAGTVGTAENRVLLLVHGWLAPDAVSAMVKDAASNNCRFI